jgi:hypothetical protein
VGAQKQVRDLTFHLLGAEKSQILLSGRNLTDHHSAYAIQILTGAARSDKSSERKPNIPQRNTMKFSLETQDCMEN